MEGFTDDTADDDDESGGIHYKQKHMDRFKGRAVQANRVHLACASLSGFLGITFCGTRNQDFGGPTTKILVSLTINPITTTTTTTTSLIINLYILIRQS